jgi:hypothetical protein
MNIFTRASSNCDSRKGILAPGCGMVNATPYTPASIQTPSYGGRVIYGTQMGNSVNWSDGTYSTKAGNTIQHSDGSRTIIMGR